MTSIARSFALLLAFYLPSVPATDLGVIGDAFPIAETDFLDFIHGRLGQLEADGTLAREQEKFKQRVIDNTLRPPPVEGITRATEYTRTTFNPSFVVDEDKRDTNGRIFVRKGVVVNPLTYTGFNQTLYFIDADDPAQIKWIKAQQPSTLEYKVILVNGNVKDASDAVGVRMYFDQGGTLVQRLGIKAVPARVTASLDKSHLIVEQFVAGDEP
jgi:conjugal transfer pilus assembly protein TraW